LNRPEREREKGREREIEIERARKGERASASLAWKPYKNLGFFCRIQVSFAGLFCKRDLYLTRASASLTWKLGRVYAIIFKVVFEVIRVYAAYR